MLHKWIVLIAIFAIPGHVLAQTGGLRNGDPAATMRNGAPLSGLRSGAPLSGVRGGAGVGVGNGGGAALPADELPTGSFTPFTPNGPLGQNTPFTPFAPNASGQ